MATEEKEIVLHLMVKIFDLPIMVALLFHFILIFIDLICTITVLGTIQEHKYLKLNCNFKNFKELKFANHIFSALIILNNLYTHSQRTPVYQFSPRKTSIDL